MLKHQRGLNHENSNTEKDKRIATTSQYITVPTRACMRARDSESPEKTSGACGRGNKQNKEGTIMVLLIGLLAFVSGLMLVALLPYAAKGIEKFANWLPRTSGDSNLSEGVINTYRKMGIHTLASPAVLCVKRSNGGYDWVPAKRKGAELVAHLDGEEKSWEDPLGNAGRLYGKLFAIVHEDNNILLSPSHLAAAEKYIEKKARDEVVIDTSGATNDADRARYVYTGVPAGGGTYVNAGIFPDVVRGNCDPGAGNRVREIVKKMYQDFNSRSILDKLFIIGAFPVGVGTVWLLWKVVDVTTSSGGGGGVSIPIGSVAGVLI